MNIKLEKATTNDIDALVEMRLEYLLEDYGSLTGDQLTKIKSSLPDYYQKHLGRDLLVYVARADKLDYIELKSTDDGYPLYQSLGFQEAETRYRSMKLVRDLFVNI